MIQTSVARTFVPRMENYRNMERGLGVTAYEMGDTYITVRLHTGHVYRYTHCSAGRANVEHMKLLARAGDGLNNFIHRYVNGLHERTGN